MSREIEIGILGALALLKVAALIWFWRELRCCEAEYAAAKADRDKLFAIWSRWAQAAGGEDPKK